MADPRIRQLTIKTGVVKRLAKEKTVYEKEVRTERSRLEKFRNDGADEHVLRKQEEVIMECEMMVPDSKKRYFAEIRFVHKTINVFLMILQAYKGVRDIEEVPGRRGGSQRNGGLHQGRRSYR